VPAFATTRWSLILDAREAPETARRALEQICRDYRGPVLSYVRRAGHSPSDAEDLTQEFFARFLERRWHARADPARGRFRNYLLTALRRFLLDVRAHDTARKRGGGQFTADLDAAGAQLAAPASESPEQAFTRLWMDTVLAHAMRALREEQRAAGKLERFEQLAGFLAESPDPSAYRELGESLGIRANTLAVTVHRLRQRLRELVREELLQTVADPDALEEEWRALREAVTRDLD
jgi:RNA polymerase sigma factor (sigma-70 family)